MLPICEPNIEVYVRPDARPGINLQSIGKRDILHPLVEDESFPMHGHRGAGVEVEIHRR